MRNLKKQSGLSLITAVFLITGLALLAALMTRLMVMQSEETLNEWYSAQALYAAETGIDWAANDLSNGGGGITVNTAINPESRVTTAISSVTSGSRTLYTITSTGAAGGTVANPRVQRQIVVQFMP